MSTPQIPPNEPPEHGDEDRFLTVGGPIMGGVIGFAFAVGVLAGQVKDVPPGMVTVIGILIGVRVVGKVIR